MEESELDPGTFSVCIMYIPLYISFLENIRFLVLNLHEMKHADMQYNGHKKKKQTKEVKPQTCMI